MPYVPGDLAGMLAAIEATAPQLSQLLREVKNPQANAIGVWDVGETAAHVAHCYNGFLAMAQGTYGALPGLDEIGDANAAYLVESSERDPDVLADQVELGAKEFVGYMRSVVRDPLVRWFGDTQVPRSAMAGVLLGEVLVHGFDIARAEGLPWTIDPSYAAFSIEGSLPVLPHFVDQEKAADVEARFDLRIRGDGRSFWRFKEGRLTIEPPSAVRVDCHLSVEPVAFMLVSYKRIAPWGPALGGKLLVWGRKPWLGLRLPTLLTAT
jgi:uncharacterized protein (TIGR03083 family)